MSARARLKSIDFPVWQFPAMELANLSAMPPWLVDRCSTGEGGLYIERTEVRTLRTIVAKPGDWVALMPNGEIMVISAEDFEKGWELTR